MEIYRNKVCFSFSTSDQVNRDAKIGYLYNHTICHKLSSVFGLCTTWWAWLGPFQVFFYYNTFAVLVVFSLSTLLLLLIILNHMVFFILFNSKTFLIHIDADTPMMIKIQVWCGQCRLVCGNIGLFELFTVLCVLFFLTFESFDSSQRWRIKGFSIDLYINMVT